MTAPSSDFFVIGRRYTNRIGTYEVLDLGPEGMVVRYDDGREDTIANLRIQERIVRNVRLGAAGVAAYPLEDMRNAGYFWALGFLAGRGRFEAMVPKRAQRGFEKRYEGVKGSRPVPGEDMYYLHPDPATDKWGSELRISFDAPPDEMDRMDFASDVDVVEGAALNEHRINNNRFVWRLFQAGFSLGADQDAQAIRTSVPTEFREDFDEGLAAATTD